MQISEKTRSKVLKFAVVYYAIATAVMLILPLEVILLWIKIFMVIGLASTCYWAYIQKFDWDYVIENTEFEGFASEVYFGSNHMFSFIIDSATEIDGIKYDAVNIFNCEPSNKFWGRWSVFEVPGTTIRLYRDNTKFVHCWYVIS